MKLCKQPLRPSLAEIVRLVRRELTIAVPFIKKREAQWIIDILHSQEPHSPVTTTIMTDIRSESILSGSLDVSALLLFTSNLAADIITVPRLHAKVYVADGAAALITSSNLTASGLDSNLEYGVATRSPKCVKTIRRDLLAYSRLGNPVSRDTLHNMSSIGEELAASFAAAQRKERGEARREFERLLRDADYAFLSAQVGQRTASSLFSEAIILALDSGSLSTRELHPRIQSMLPDLCDDSVELVINGGHYGKKWKHAVRNAQQYLKRRGRIRFDGDRWQLVTNYGGRGPARSVFGSSRTTCKSCLPI